MAWLLYMSCVCLVDKIYNVVKQAKRGKDEGRDGKALYKRPAL